MDESAASDALFARMLKDARLVRVTFRVPVGQLPAGSVWHVREELVDELRRRRDID